MIPPLALGNGSYDLHIITNEQSQYFLSGGFNVILQVGHFDLWTTYFGKLDTIAWKFTHSNATITGTDLQSFLFAGNAQVSLENRAVSIPGTLVVVVKWGQQL